ncbi:MAG: hypothetical protein ACI80H_000115 [Pseudoalteromonas distincta]|jgi:hypothetical protein
MCLSLLLCVAGLSYGQIYKMEEAVEEGNFKRLEKVCLSALEEREFSKKPEVYYYLSQAYVELSKDPIYFEKNDDAVKLATKSMLKGMRKDEGYSELNSDFSDVKEAVMKRQTEEAMAQYNINKKSKAAQYFSLVNQIDSTNRFAYYMTGKSYIESLDTAMGEVIYANLMQWYKEDVASGIKDAEQEIDPHVYFIDKYWREAKYDSAKLLISNGRQLFGNNARLNFYQKIVILDQIKNMPPSQLMLDYVQEALVNDPTDDVLLHKENSVFIFLIKNKVVAEKWVETDSLINIFVRQKVAKSSLKEAQKIKETDVFVEKKAENVLWKLAEYYQTYGHLETAKPVLNKYIESTANSDSSTDIAKRWNVITNYAFETKSLPYAGFVLQQAIAKYPNNTDLKNTRAKIIAEKEVVRTNVDEQGALYLLMQDQYAADKNADNLKKLLAINDKYLGLLAGANRFSTARGVMAEQIRLDSTKDHTVRLQYMAKEDFYQNYYLTRTKGKDLDGNEMKHWTWNGSKSGCDAGEIDIEIQEKVANRINYFRRNAGVPEVLFDAATNEYCQSAALMMTANNKLEHDPPKTWRCWSSEGAYAAKHSLLIKDANTSLAVTYAMDDKNSSAGNRRWLLYPNGKVYGHGSTDNIAVIWALDDSGSEDTARYKENAVTWPPKGYVPQLMLFSNWTFSLYQDLTDAKVEVIQDGTAIEVNVEKFVRGYGAPTLVFTPVVNKTALPDKSVFDVTVTLSNGSKYSYTINTFSYNPAR